jgi:hypothetical protein
LLCRIQRKRTASQAYDFYKNSFLEKSEKKGVLGAGKGYFDQMKVQKK